ncbi:PKS_ER domain-containing protein [Haematococcus lacustris]|uniref:PKS_ER domain-containing protein n=1 Tax=Haematococcus lacustris TaxID=44745 RepID=A0A6A0A2B6_HAELA|nr:PKS_ER domain-containing protein [Haematococcus lacustris]
MFWSGQEHCGPEGRRVLGRIWPSDPAAVARAKARVFDLHDKGMLTALVDVQPGGIQAVPDAIDYMLRGQHIGKWLQ